MTFEELHALAMAVAELDLTSYSDPIIECNGCSGKMHEGAGSIRHDYQCPIIAMRAALGLDEHGFPVRDTPASPQNTY